MVNAATDFTLFFFSELFEKGRGLLFASSATWQFGIGWQAPGLASEKRPGDLPGREPVAYRSLRKTVLFGEIADRNILHNSLAIGKNLSSYHCKYTHFCRYRQVFLMLSR